MAFPIVGSAGQSFEDTLATVHDVVLPASHVSGDLLIMFTTLDTNPTISGMPSGWVLLSRQTQAAQTVTEVWYLIAAGGEGNFTFTSSLGRESMTRVLRVTAATWHGTTPPEAAAVEGATVNPDPPSLNPAGWGAEDTLWIAHHGTDRNRVTSVYPTNYADNQFQARSSNTTNAAHHGIATRELNAASDDPGQFTIDAADQWTAHTVAVRPAAATTPSLLWAPQPLHALIGR